MPWHPYTHKCHTLFLKCQWCKTMNLSQQPFVLIVNLLSVQFAFNRNFQSVLMLSTAQTLIANYFVMNKSPNKLGSLEHDLLLCQVLKCWILLKKDNIIISNKIGHCSQVKTSSHFVQVANLKAMMNLKINAWTVDMWRKFHRKNG